MFDHMNQQTLGECTPIIFATEAFRAAYEWGIEAQCSSPSPFMSEQELIAQTLECFLYRWDHEEQKPISLEWSVGFLVRRLHALFVPALAYTTDEGLVSYLTDDAQPESEPTTDPLPVVERVG